MQMLFPLFRNVKVCGTSFSVVLLFGYYVLRFVMGARRCRSQLVAGSLSHHPHGVRLTLLSTSYILPARNLGLNSPRLRLRRIIYCALRNITYTDHGGTMKAVTDCNNTFTQSGSGAVISCTCTKLLKFFHKHLQYDLTTS